MWKLFQLSVFVGVLFANVYFEWTPNGYLASLLGIGAAYLATVILTRSGLVLKAWLRRPALQQGADKRLS
jgi:uncharacterized membrane protein